MMKIHVCHRGSKSELGSQPKTANFRHVMADSTRGHQL